MRIAASIFVGLVAVLHLVFLVLEMFLVTKPIGRKVFALSEEEAKVLAPALQNQGLYNGFLVAGLVWSLVAEPALGFQLQVFFLTCVVLAGVVGAFTVKRSILFVQGVPAAIALTLVWLASRSA